VPVSAGIGKVLVLARKPGQKIVIGSALVMELLGVDSAQRAALAFESPQPLRLSSADIRLHLSMPAGTPENPAHAELALAVNQSVRVNEEVSVMVVSVKGDQVRLGFTAPPEVQIFREEVYLEIQRENIAAAQAGGKLSSEEVKDLLSKLGGGEEK
jgi:carbon storage regulator